MFGGLRRLSKQLDKWWQAPIKLGAIYPSFVVKLEIQCAVVVSAESNCRSAWVHGDIIENYLKAELDRGSIAGPVPNPPIHD